MTIAVLLVHSGLQGGKAKTTTTLGSVTSVRSSTTTTTNRQPPGKKRFYTVQTGDTFGSIAAKVGISVSQLQSLNPGVSSNSLQVGQKLRTR